MGVTSTATVGPKDDWPSVRLRLVAGPTSRTAISFSPDCARVLEQEGRDQVIRIAEQRHAFPSLSIGIVSESLSHIIGENADRGDLSVIAIIAN